MAHADKRTVATDALETLGKIIGASEQRDAIHLAVEPVTAACVLRPGEHVGFVPGGVGIAPPPETVGIVDPFLTRLVQPGERFWLIVYPRQITSLRHVWMHPKFPENADVQPAALTEKEQSAAWIKNFAESVGLGSAVIMGGAQDWLASKRAGQWGEYLSFGGLLEGVSVPDEFWKHYEIVTGETVPDAFRGSFFSCSC